MKLLTFISVSETRLVWCGKESNLSTITFRFIFHPLVAVAVVYKIMMSPIKNKSKP